MVKRWKDVHVKGLDDLLSKWKRLFLFVRFLIDGLCERDLATGTF